MLQSVNVKRGDAQGSLTHLHLLQSEERVEGRAACPQPHQFIVEGHLSGGALTGGISQRGLGGLAAVAGRVRGKPP